MPMSLGERMKRYEEASSIILPHRMPVIIRIDGKCFHSLLRRSEKPFDDFVMTCMDKIAYKLLEEIQGAVLAFVQSDEVSVLVVNYNKFDYEPWFSNKIQKLASISASIATAYFNQLWSTKNESIAKFDARAFVLPKEDVNNYFIWRQQDIIRNAIQMVGRSVSSQKQLHGKSCKDIIDYLKEDRNFDYNTLSSHKRLGRVYTKEQVPFKLENKDEKVMRNMIVCSSDTPLFKADRDFVNDLVNIQPETVEINND